MAPKIHVKFLRQNSDHKNDAGNGLNMKMKETRRYMK